MLAQVCDDVSRQLAWCMVCEQATSWGGVEGRETLGGQEGLLGFRDGIRQEMAPADGVGWVGGECQERRIWW